MDVRTEGKKSRKTGKQDNFLRYVAAGGMKAKKKFW